MSSTSTPARSRSPRPDAGEARVEPGYQYLIAVAWQQARCSPGDRPVPARWRALGSDAILPYDDHKVGLGENEGHAQTVSQAAAKADKPGPELPAEAQLAGKGNVDVRSALQATPPGKRLDFGPRASKQRATDALAFRTVEVAVLVRTTALAHVRRPRGSRLDPVAAAHAVCG